jgi:hypothetical protein
MHSPAPGQNADHGVPLIEKQTGQHVYVIVAGSHPRLATCPRRTVIPCLGTWLESTDAGQFMNAPPLCGLPLGELADAVLYLGQPTVLTRSLWNPAIFLDPVYWANTSGATRSTATTSTWNSTGRTSRSPGPRHLP